MGANFCSAQVQLVELSMCPGSGRTTADRDIARARALCACVEHRRALGSASCTCSCSNVVSGGDLYTQEYVHVGAGGDRLSGAGDG